MTEKKFSISDTGVLTPTEPVLAQFKELLNTRGYVTEKEFMELLDLGTIPNNQEPIVWLDFS